MLRPSKLVHSTTSRPNSTSSVNSEVCARTSLHCECTNLEARDPDDIQSQDKTIPTQCIRLVSKDGTSFIVPMKVAAQCEMLKEHTSKQYKDSPEIFMSPIPSRKVVLTDEAEINHSLAGVGGTNELDEIMRTSYN
eukprot:gnl/Chilomastix_caulleri/393.p1 GENE.gnl/Chilomastix_caulleri/393~~gnl/Chilomastix_caulleri/393.p1  ORF type:complete len:136 (+),score=41.33 gnl/Chilomastix_caulleri/393:43-450(+)